ncbi:putative baseplate assembly protein [Kitasatospora sp. NPDC001660]
MSGPTCRGSCCSGIGTSTPTPIWNRPGLPALGYRVGTYGQFLDSMLARLSGDSHPQLATLTTREPDDPSIALLDGWAVIADILTFYQERIANEGYLRTAVEEESLARLGTLVGHRPRPALAAGTFLAYTLDPGTRSTVPAGSQVKSAPPPGGLPQTFETSEDLTARAEWNRLPVQQTGLPGITPDTAGSLPLLELSGVHPTIGAGDRLLFTFTTPDHNCLRVVSAGRPDPQPGRTEVDLEVPGAVERYADSLGRLAGAIETATPEPSAEGIAVRDAIELSAEAAQALAGLLDAAHGRGSLPDPSTIAPAFGSPLTALTREIGAAQTQGKHELEKHLNAVAEAARAAMAAATEAAAEAGAEAAAEAADTEAVAPTPAEPEPPEQPAAGAAEAVTVVLPAPGFAAAAAPGTLAAAAPTTAPAPAPSLPGPLQAGQVATALDAIVPLLDGLARPPARPPAGRNEPLPPVADLFRPESDTLLRLLAAARPGIAGQLYSAVAGAPPAASDQFTGVFRFRVKAAPLGATIPDAVDAHDHAVPGSGIGQLSAEARSGDGRDLTLDAVYDTILPGSWIAVRTVTAEDYVPDRTPRIIKVTDVTQLAVAGQNYATKVTQLRLEKPWTRRPAEPVVRRATTVWAAGEQLPVVGPPITEDVSGRRIELAGAFDGLAPGRWLIVSGERAVVSGEPTGLGPTTRVPGTELVMLGGVEQSFIQPSLPGDRVRTTLVLATDLAYSYRRDTVVIHGNVVPATAGESRSEVLGSGDATQAGQTLPLRQSPLTWLPATTPDGSAPTLTVRVGAVTWPRTEDLTALGPADAGYRLLTTADGGTAVGFGDGLHGRRLPTGVENVTATYRIGGGSAGNLAADQINQVVSRPLGVSSATNPLPSTGGTDTDDPAYTRTAIPLRLGAFDRLVSVRDHQDFALAFAGIGKALARRCSDGRRSLVQVTVAAVADAALDAGSPLVAALQAALNRYGDPQLPVLVDVCHRVRLVLAAGVRVLPDHGWDTVEPAVRAALLRALGFAAADIGRPVYLSTAIAAVQAVPGVDHVNVDVFAGLPDDLRPDDLKAVAGRLTTAAICVPAAPAGDGPQQSAGDAMNPLRPDPAQLVLLDPALPETLILRRIP